MALPARPMHVPAGLPIDEATRVELVDAGKANVANVNVRSHNPGSLSRRFGYRGSSVLRIGGSARTSGQKLFAHEGVPTVISEGYLESYIDAANANSRRSRVPECLFRLWGLPTASSSSVVVDTEVCRGLVAVSVVPDGVAAGCVCVVSATTGATVRSPEVVTPGPCALASFGSRYFVAVSVDSGTGIAAFIFDTLNIAAGWVSLATVAASSIGILPAVCSLGDRIAVAYGTSSGTDRVTVKTYNASGILETRTINTSSTTTSAIDADAGADGTLWVAWDEGTAVKAIGLDADALATTVATTATVVSALLDVEALGICAGASAGTARVWVTDDLAPARLRMASLTTVGGAVTPGTGTTVINVTPSSRPFLQGGRYYMACWAGTEVEVGENDQQLCIVVDWTEDVPYFRPVANIEPGLVAPSLFRPKVPMMDWGRRCFALQSVTSGSSDFDAIFTDSTTSRTSLVVLDFATRERWQTVEHANSTFIGGGILCVYDGNVVTESGFLVRPITPTTSAGSTGITGTYRYVAIYEDVDAAGNWVVSSISKPSESRTVTDKTITVTTAPCPISMRCDKRVSPSSNRSTVRVAWYRTANGGEAPYYRLGVTEYDLSSVAVTFADSTSDADLTQRAKPYAPNLPGAASEALDRRAPPGLIHPASYNGMLVGARGESVFHSGQEVYGEATWFSPVFEVPITGGGDITGIRAMDGAVFVFKADRVFALSGDAPSDNGLAGGLGTPRLIASDAGCVDANSLVVTSLGIFFQSARGLELLTRSQTVEPIGEPVQATLASFPVVTSAVLDDVNGLVRFSLAAAEEDGVVSGEGRDIVFDLTLKAWISVDSKTGSSDAQASQSATMVVADGARRYAWLGADGVVYQERRAGDGSDHLDGTTFFESSYTLPPWKLGLQQEQRIYEMQLLFERHASAGLAIDVAYDYAPTFVETKSWTPADLAGQRQIPFRPKSRSTAVQLRIRDLPGSDGGEGGGTGRGITFIGISADIAAKQGPTRGTTRLNTDLRR